MLLLVSTSLIFLSTRFLIVDTTRQNESTTVILTRNINQGSGNSNQLLRISEGKGKSFSHINEDNNNVTLSEIDSQFCSSTTNSCPTWFVCNDTEFGKCQCGPRYQDAIKCVEKKDENLMISAVLSCYCVTESLSKGENYLGLCFYNCERHSHNKYQDIYHEISDKTDLNEYMCGRFNRTGISCSKCAEGLSPLVLSYNLSCVNCTDGNKNWWKFVVAGFVPLTFFYFFVVFFNVNVTSSRLRSFIFFSQALSTPALVRVILLAIDDRPQVLKAFKILEPFYSLWNLDPLRSILPDICLHVSTLEAFALEACVAVYPLILICFSYFLIELYDHNVRFVVFIWKPFRFIFRRFRENWDTRTSVIDSFSTFFLLSYVKILNVCVDLMLSTPVHELHSNKTHYRLYYDANVKFGDRYHIPFLVLSLILFLLLILIPTLVLMLFPFRWFQKCLSYFRIQWHFLYAFVDSFQGCYKDGTDEGTYDLRWLSLYGPLLKFGICITFTLTLSSMYFIYVVVLIVVVIIVLINFQPYKTSVSHYTVIDASFLILLCLFFTSINGNNVTSNNGQRYLNIFNGLSTVTCIIPIIYVIFIVLHWMYSRWTFGKTTLIRVCNTMKHLCLAKHRARKLDK